MVDAVTRAERPFDVAVAGASGRMGQMLIRAVLDAPDCRLAGAVAPAGRPIIGQDAGLALGDHTGVTVTDDLRGALSNARYLIDFTRPEGTLAALPLCRELGTKLIIGTTGFDAAQKQQIAEAARDIAIVLAPNMSVGVNVTLKLLELAAKALRPGYDIEIIEAHHRHKVDAPSGTALAMGESIAAALGERLEDVAVYGRHGYTGERKEGTIGFSAIRGGDIVGDHTAMFAGIGERIEITHRSSSRATYAQGSLQAVRYLATQDRGLYDMQDVLSLR